MFSKEISISKKIQTLIKIIIILSTPILSLILSRDTFRYNDLIYPYILVMILSLLTIVILIKKVTIDKIKIGELLISLGISAYTMKLFIHFSSYKLYMLFHYLHLDKISGLIRYGLSIIAYPALVFFVYLFIKNIVPKIKEFINGLTKAEKKYIIIIAIISIIISSGISLFTTAFTRPVTGGFSIMYDAVYTSDTFSLVDEDAFTNIMHPENDIRQPLFGVFALPFGLTARLISELLFFLPQERVYGAALMIIQFILAALTNILLARLLKLEEKEKKYLYLFLTLSFPYLVFTLVIEQYMVALFYLVLSIYLCNQKVNYTYIGAVGTLLTSGIIFPTITNERKIKSWITNIFKCFIAFLVIMILSGQINQAFYVRSELNALKMFNEGVPFNIRLYQFTDFVRSLFIGIKGYIAFNKFPAYRLIMPTSINIIGIVILAVMLISTILNRKNKMAIISFLWIIFSFILLCVVGWGTSENGLILYSLYFAWSYLILLYLLIKKICKKELLFKIVYAVTLLIMFGLGSIELLHIISFAIKYY